MNTDELPDEAYSTDPEAVADALAKIDAYLDSPVTQSLNEDLGRAFRREPAEKQIAELEVHIEQEQSHLQRVLELIEAKESAKARLALGQLREQIQDNIEGAQQRIIELRLDGPDR